MTMNPGEYFLESGDIIANAGRKTVTILVKNTGDRPVQVGSHFHFFEVNSALHFDRPAAYGMRLNIAAGTSSRFEPGDEKEIVACRVCRRTQGVRPQRTRKWTFGSQMSLPIPRRTYADLYGPTKGDRVRLADTELLVEVEHDYTTYGDEVTFGGGKVIRDGMGQSSTATREGADWRARLSHH